MLKAQVSERNTDFTMLMREKEKLQKKLAITTEHFEKKVKNIEQYNNECVLEINQWSEKYNHQSEIIEDLKYRPLISNLIHQQGRRSNSESKNSRFLPTTRRLWSNNKSPRRMNFSIHLISTTHQSRS